MTVRTPIVIAAAAAVLGLSACGERGAGGGAPGATAASFEEPVDAVPLPLDENPLTPPPVAEPVVAAEKKTDEAESQVDPAEAPILVTPPQAAAPNATPPQGPAATARPAPPRETSRPTPTPAPQPAPQPVPSPEPRSEGERPVLNF